MAGSSIVRDKLKTQSKNKWEEEYLKNNPPTITIDTVPDPYRVTRHDMIQQTETSQRRKKSGGKQTNESNKSGYKYWETHPKTKKYSSTRAEEFRLLEHSVFNFILVMSSKSDPYLN